MEQSFWRNQWLHLRSWNCQNYANLAQTAKKWLKKLGQVARKAAKGLDLDSELVSYLNSYQKMQFKSLREKGTQWKPLCVSWGLPNRWWQPDASPGEHRDRSGYLKSSAARGEVPSSYCQAWTKWRLTWAGSLQTPRAATEWARKAGCCILILIATQS